MMPPSAWSLLTPRVESRPSRTTAPRAPHGHSAAVRRAAAAPDAPVTIRRALPEDAAVVAHLSALDSVRPLHGDVLIAETEHGPMAALEVDTGRAAADPFSPSAGAVGLLRLRAQQLRDVGATARHPRAARLAHPLRGRAARALR